MAASGARTPDATPSKKEREAAERDLARATRASAPLLVVGGALLGSVGFALLLVPVLGIFGLLYAGVIHLFLGGPDEFQGDARPVLRVVLVAFAVVWPTLFVGFSVRAWRRQIRGLRLVASGARPPRTLATFRSARFNTTEDREAFVNPGCFGDDVVQVLLDGLSADGFEVDPEPGAEDFGWYGRFRLAEDDDYDLIVAFQPEDDAGAGTWFVHVERSGAPLSANRRRRGGGVESAAVSAVHGVLARTDGVSDLRWHFGDPDVASATAA